MVVVGARVVGARVVGARVVGARVVGARVVGARVVGALVVGIGVVGTCVVEALEGSEVGRCVGAGLRTVRSGAVAGATAAPEVVVLDSLEVTTSEDAVTEVPFTTTPPLLFSASSASPSTTTARVVEVVVRSSSPIESTSEAFSSEGDVERATPTPTNTSAATTIRLATRLTLLWYPMFLHRSGAARPPIKGLSETLAISVRQTCDQ